MENKIPSKIYEEWQLSNNHTEFERNFSEVPKQKTDND